MSYRFVFFILLLFGFSCNNPEPKTQVVSDSSNANLTNAAYDTFQVDSLIYKVYCKTDTTLSYSLYLPKGYSIKSKLPIVVFFDPHAAGSLPLKKYQELASELGFIMVGSNDSKNGNSYERSNHILNMLFADIENRIQYDERRFYVAGFSGGARVAGGAALSFPMVKGVVASGAGIPDPRSTNNNSFIWIGVAGDEDFNIGELSEQNKFLQQTKISHQLIVFSGDHSWCPIQIMRQVIYGLYLQSMKQYPETKNDSLVAKYAAEMQNVVSSESKPFQYQSLVRTIYNLNGLTDIFRFTEQIKKLEADPVVLKHEQKQRQIQKMENELKQLYLNAFVNNDIDWWKKLNQTLRKKVGDKDQQKMNKRILSFLSLAAFMNSSSALKQNDLEIAKKFLSIYEIVDPENAEHAYLHACLFGRMGDIKNAQAYYNKAIKLGFKDAERAAVEKDLMQIQL